MTNTDINTELNRQLQLESDQHLFEMFLIDHIDNQVQRMMEGDFRNPKFELEIKELCIQTR